MSGFCDKILRNALLLCEFSATSGNFLKCRITLEQSNQIKAFYRGMKTATIDSVPISQWIVSASIPQHFVTRHLKYEKTVGDAMRIFRRHISLHFLLVSAPFSPHEFNKKIKKKMQPCELLTSFSLFQWRYYLIIKINISMVPHQHRTVKLFYRKTGIVASLIFSCLKP